MSLNTAFTAELQASLDQLKADRVYKTLNYLSTPQSARVQMEGRGEVLILSSNNYLGLCDEPSVIQAGIDGLKRFGAGTGSVRFICGTFTIHRELEAALARFVGTEAAMTYVSAWTANEGLTPLHRARRGLRRQRCAQPRQHHRQHPAGEVDHEVHHGRLQARRSGRPARKARRQCERAAASDLD